MAKIEHRPENGIAPWVIVWKQFDADLVAAYQTEERALERLPVFERYENIDPCFVLLSPEQKQDVLSGKLKLSSYLNTPILSEA